MPPPASAPASAAFYTAQSPYSDPGALASCYVGLPRDPVQLARVVRGLLVHRREGDVFGQTLDEERVREDAQSRYVDELLRLVTERDDAPLTSPRTLADRFVGASRDFALLHTSLLRHVGIPARVRCGFADYFGHDGFHGAFHEEHAVTEFWDARRGWVLADPRLMDRRVAGALGIDFAPMDVPRGRFLVSGRAWHALRAGEADPLAFGAREGAGDGAWGTAKPPTGVECAAGVVRLDLAALNRHETLLWDVWGTRVPYPRYDEVATLTGDEVPFDAARAFFRDDEALRVPRTVRSEPPYGEAVEVTLR